MADKVVIWDFDGTLAFREGRWRSALLQALDELEPGHGVTNEEVRGGLRNGFPWHQPERPHPELCEPEKWWAEVEGLVARVFHSVGFNADRSRALGAATHRAFVDPASHRVFGDTRPALKCLSEAGWRHVILSNHVPELEEIVVALGLRSHFEAVLSSALTGYEKPHPEAFRLALHRAGSPQRAWMVGDNLVADVEGAERVGIPAILVGEEGLAARRAPGPLEAARIILAEEEVGSP